MTCASSLHVSIFNQAGFRSLRNIFLPFLPEYLLRLVRLARTYSAGQSDIQSKTKVEHLSKTLRPAPEKSKTGGNFCLFVVP